MKKEHEEDGFFLVLSDNFFERVKKHCAFQVIEDARSSPERLKIYELFFSRSSCWNFRTGRTLHSFLKKLTVGGLVEKRSDVPEIQFAEAISLQRLLKSDLTNIATAISPY
uniref:Ribosomal RNA large subunit methyltransferase H n=1 Tax=Lygus hesperus TaxID=30085 RepID=A0A0A9XF88_LYGHE